MLTTSILFITVFQYFRKYFQENLNFLVIIFGQVKNLTYLCLYKLKEMKDIFQIDERYDSYQDENLKFLEEFSNKEFNLQSGLIFVDRKEFEFDEKEARKKISDPKNQSWGILEKEITSIIQEKERLIRLFHKFYTSSVSENPELKDITPHKLQYIISQLMIRIKRLDCVIDTQFSSTKFFEKKSGHTYLMGKGYWIKGDGTRVRNISRNITNTESSMIELVMKIIKLNDKSVTLMELEKGSKYKPDFTIYDGPNEWYVELKTNNMNNLVKTFIMFETWKIYRSEYELLTE